MLAGCCDNSLRKLEVSRLLWTVAFNSRTLQRVFMDYGDNREPGLSFSDLFELVTKSSWILRNVHRSQHLFGTAANCSVIGHVVRCVY